MLKDVLDAFDAIERSYSFEEQKIFNYQKEGEETTVSAQKAFVKEMEALQHSFEKQPRDSQSLKKLGREISSISTLLDFQSTIQKDLFTIANQAQSTSVKRVQQTALVHFGHTERAFEYLEKCIALKSISTAEMQEWIAFENEIARQEAKMIAGVLKSLKNHPQELREAKIEEIRSQRQEIRKKQLLQLDPHKRTRIERFEKDL